MRLPTYRTDRLIIRPLAIEDIPVLLALHQDAEVMMYEPPVTDRDAHSRELRDWITRSWGEGSASGASSRSLIPGASWGGSCSSRLENMDPGRRLAGASSGTPGVTATPRKPRGASCSVASRSSGCRTSWQACTPRTNARDGWHCASDCHRPNPGWLPARAVHSFACRAKISRNCAVRRVKTCGRPRRARAGCWPRCARKTARGRGRGRAGSANGPRK